MQLLPNVLVADGVASLARWPFVYHTMILWHSGFDGCMSHVRHSVMLACLPVFGGCMQGSIAQDIWMNGCVHGCVRKW